MNIWGPIKTASLEDHRYFISVVDNYSKRCWVYPMRQRVKVLELLMKWKNLMKNQISRKIKVLRYDHIEEFKDSFLQFGQNNSIVTHFINGKDGIAKEINRYLLEKVQYLLSNALIDKSFWT